MNPPIVAVEWKFLVFSSLLSFPYFPLWFGLSSRFCYSVGQMGFGAEPRAKITRLTLPRGNHISQSISLLLTLIRVERFFSQIRD